MTLVRWNPVGELASMEVDRLNRMFSGFYGGLGRAWVPAVDVYENDNHEFVLKVELPEMKREDIAITYDNGVLTLKGERTGEVAISRENYHRVERQHGSFTRSFTLPATVDPARIQASYTDGVLTIRVPQHEEAKPKQIEIKE